ncbi:quinone-dependent dihydroorotate dehydrogenase [Pararhizobium haloflavum]|uniref:quinone-dependent dihydroorotate dehydrogenase n=1 Tax=Pararhizobium haloflavum TaxID=2037914 RepID=UPI000C18A268|nr:quinone-dependent dihydroorotate dehydrogenase [Pararhizobium haloflavum]
MSRALNALGRGLLHRLDPETAHGLALRALANGLVSAPPVPRDKRLETKVAGLTLPNPVGMAAGFDKNAEVPNELLKLGFGFVEVGTVTPRPQPGNPRPRIFRLRDDDAIINRLGFNNDGHERALARLKTRSRRAGILGVNIGANRDSEDRIADYGAGIKAFSGVTDYFTVNISSPNTPGLRDLQSAENLEELLKAVTAARDASSNISGKRIPIFLKVAPDLDDEGIETIARSTAGIDGIVVSNTTIARPSLHDADKARETGGLSGRPLFERSTIVLARMRRAIGPEMPLIGVGGVDGAKTALSKIMAGADLVQLYSGFIFRGPTLMNEILSGLIETLDRDGEDSIAAYRDRETEEWAARPLTA